MADLAGAIRALEQRPSDPEAWSNLGVHLLRAGQSAQAEEAFSQSVRLRPTERGLAGWAECAAQMGDVNQAVGRLTAARTRGLLAPSGLRRLGELALRGDDLGAAVDALSTYNQHQPADAMGWLLHAIAHTRAGRGHDALPMLDRAVMLAPNLTDAHANRASVLETLSRLPEAERSARRALQQASGHALATLTLARVLRRQARPLEAIALLEALPDDELSPGQCARKYADLGLCADKQGDADGAWTAFSTLNRHARQRKAVREQNTHSWTTRAQQIETLAPELVHHALQPWTPPTTDRPPVFVVGFPRSGTTLLERFLGAHPQLVATDEMGVIDRILRQWDHVLSTGHVYPQGLLELEGPQRHRLRALWFEWMREERPHLDPALRVIDKGPLNLIHLPLLHAIFPESPKVVLLRDPRDSALSCFMQDFAPGAVNNLMMDMGDIVRTQALAFRIFQQMQPALTEHLHVLRYEDLVADHHLVMTRLIAALGLPWDDAVDDHRTSLNNTHIKTPSYARVMQPVDRSACKRWHRYVHHLRPWRATLDQTAALLGYETHWPDDPPRSHRPEVS